MYALLFAAIATLAALGGGFMALANWKSLNLTLGFTAGALLGLVAFDILPEIFEITSRDLIDIKWPMVGLIGGFLLFHIVEKTILIHQSHERRYVVHQHPHVGIASAVALASHSFLDGMGIGLAFQINKTVGVAVGVAVIGHRFADGFNSVNLMLINKNSRDRALKILLVVAAAPIIGAISTLYFSISEAVLAIYLGFFAGFLLYISAGDILPQAHSQGSSRKTIAMTVLGVAAIYAVTTWIHI